MELNELIRQKRREKNMTQQELADMLFVSNKTISKWETGRGIPDINMVSRLSLLLEISADVLLGAVNSSETIEKTIIKDKIKVVIMLTSLIFFAGIMFVLICFYQASKGDDFFFIWAAFGILLVASSFLFYFAKEKLIIINHGFKSKNEISRYRKRMLLIWYLTSIVLPIGYLILGDKDSYSQIEIMIVSLVLFVFLTLVATFLYFLVKR